MQNLHQNYPGHFQQPNWPRHRGAAKGRDSHTHSSLTQDSAQSAFILSCLPACYLAFCITAAMPLPADSRKKLGDAYYTLSAQATCAYTGSTYKLNRLVCLMASG